MRMRKRKLIAALLVAAVFAGAWIAAPRPKPHGKPLPFNAPMRVEDIR